MQCIHYLPPSFSSQATFRPLSLSLLLAPCAIAIGPLDRNSMSLASKSRRARRATHFSPLLSHPGRHFESKAEQQNVNEGMREFR